MRMLPRPSCPRVGQSGLWQNWSCGSIGDPPGARSGDHARWDARWTRAFQAPTILITVPGGATGKGDGTFYPSVSYAVPAGRFEMGGAGDFNGDGAADFLYPSTAGVTVVMNADD